MCASVLPLQLDSPDGRTFEKNLPVAASSVPLPTSPAAEMMLTTRPESIWRRLSCVVTKMQAKELIIITLASWVFCNQNLGNTQRKVLGVGARGTQDDTWLQWTRWKPKHSGQLLPD